MVGLVLGGRVAAEVDGLRRSLGARALGRIAPHVTLVPPVNVRDDELSEALDVARRAAEAAGPVRLELGPVATFWPETPVIYLSVGGDLGSLEPLRAALFTGPLDVPKERTGRRPFVPHVTLDQRIASARLRAAMAALADYRAEVTVERLTVLEHDETTRTWSPLASYALARPRVAGRGGLEVTLSVAGVMPPDVAEWVDRRWSEYSLERYGGSYRPDEPVVLVARVAESIVGVSEADLRGLTMRVRRLIVAPEWRSSGVGGQLLRETERLARQHGCRRVRLETLAGGDAERFYARFGYVVVARLPAWREERDFVVMERLLAE